jgi:glucose/arabinose dehydrogenase
VIDQRTQNARGVSTLRIVQIVPRERDTEFLEHGDELAARRPVDILQLPDGSILISDDKGNRILRLTYRGQTRPGE